MRGAGEKAERKGRREEIEREKWVKKMKYVCEKEMEKRATSKPRKTEYNHYCRLTICDDGSNAFHVTSAYTHH